MTDKISIWGIIVNISISYGVEINGLNLIKTVINLYRTIEVACSKLSQKSLYKALAYDKLAKQSTFKYLPNVCFVCILA